MHLTTKSGRKILLNTPEEDAEITRQAIEDGTNFTDEELDGFKPFEQSDLPEEAKAVLRKGLSKGLSKGRPKLDKTKLSTTIRLDEEVITFFKSKGKGWQTRLNDVLRSYVLSHK